MIIHLADNTAVDTDRDLCPEERHILQKLLCYKLFVDSVVEFREKKNVAFRTGWNDSGPVPESSTMAKIGKQLEQEIQDRLKASRAPE